MRVHNWIKLLAGAGALTVLTGCASGGGSVPAVDIQKRQQALSSADRLIIPGERIGPIRLGMGMDEVSAMLGKPDVAYTSEYPNGSKPATWKYWSLNLALIFSSDSAPSVDTIQTIAWKGESITTIFKTVNGIGLGASSFDVKRAYSSYNYRDTEGMVMDYKNLGIIFTLEPSDHRILQIQVNEVGR